jgi:hypothetical protein
MKTRHPEPPPKPSRPILRFDPPAPAPRPTFDKPRASNALAAEAVRIAGSPGGIDPAQQRY